MRRAIFRPSALGAKLSLESIVIALFIATLMTTFLLGFNLDEQTTAVLLRSDRQREAGEEAG